MSNYVPLIMPISLLGTQKAQENSQPLFVDVQI